MRINNVSPFASINWTRASATGVPLWCTSPSAPAPPPSSPGAGALGEVRHNGKPVADARVQLMLAMGDTLLIRTPGGGGFGDPKLRDPAADERDRRLGYA